MQIFEKEITSKQEGFYGKSCLIVILNKGKLRDEILAIEKFVLEVV